MLLGGQIGTMARRSEGVKRKAIMTARKMKVKVGREEEAKFD